MIASSTSHISSLLNDPQAITDADIEQIAQVTAAYPYFVPARYITAAASHTKHPFNAGMMAEMQLYMGNWLLFHQYIQTALGDKKFEPQPVNEPLQEDIQFTSVEDFTTVEELPIEKPNKKEAKKDTNRYNFEHLQYRTTPSDNQTEEELILPIYTEDYFLHQGIQVSNNIPDNIEENKVASEEPKSLLVVMSFAEWLVHFKSKSQKSREEEDDKKALKTMWQKEKLAAALQEENEEIPENVFEMAVNSITKEESLVSEPLAEIYEKQGKYDTAIDMYRKLSLRNPQKNAYFARKIEAIQKEKES